MLSVYDEVKKPLFQISKNSLKNGTVSENTKIAQISPTFKSGKKELLTNYRPISVLPCFSKILERIMYNRLYEYLNQNNILYNKQFGFRGGHSTDHPLSDLADNTLGAETFAGRNFRDFRDFRPFSQKFLPSKIIKRKIAKVFSSENKIFS